MPKVGDVIGGNFRLEERVGVGGFAEVYRAQELRGGKSTVAVKVFFKDPDEDELSLLAKLDHPHILRYRATLEHEGRLCLVTDFADGGDAAQLLSAFPQGMPGEQVKAIVEPIAKALAYLHEMNVVHRDVKPANILFVNGQVRLGDVGIAKALAATQSTHTGFHTVSYAAPEMIRGKVHLHSDVYSLGVTAYELLTGKTPFEGVPFDVAQQHLTAPIQLPGDHSTQWNDWMSGMVTKEPDERWGSARLLVELQDKPVAEPANIETSAMTLVPKARPETHRISERELADLDGLVLGEVREGHLSYVQAVAYSADGTLIVSGGADQTVRVWSVETGEQLFQFDDPEGWVTVVAFSPDGKYVASGDTDGKVYLWSLEDGTQHIRYHQHYLASVHDLAFSPDSTLVASADHDGDVHIWKVADGRSVAKVHRGCPVYAVAFHPQVDAQQLVTGDESGTLAYWDTDGEMISRVDAHRGAITSVAYSPAGHYVATGGKDQTAKIWDSLEDELIHEFALEGDVHSLAFSIEVDSFVTLSGTSLDEWDLSDYSKLDTLNCEAFDFSLSPEYKTIALASLDSSVRIYDCGSFEEVGVLGSPQDRISALAIGGSRWAAVARSGGSVELYDLGRQELLTYFADWVESPTCASFSQDGRWLAVGGGTGFAVWDLAEAGRSLLQDDIDQLDDPFVIHLPSGVDGLCFKPGQNVLGTSSIDAMRVWDVEMREQLALLPGYWKVVEAISYMPNGTQLISASSDGEGRVWDIEAETSTRLFKNYGVQYRSLAVSRDGGSLFALTNKGVLDVREIKRLGRRFKYETGFEREGTLALSPDDSHVIISGGSQAQLVNTKTWFTTKTINDHLADITAVAFVGDGRIAATASEDGTLRFHSVPAPVATRTPGTGANTTGQHGRTLIDTCGVPLDALCISPDGAHLVVGGASSRLILIQADTGEISRVIPTTADSIQSVAFSPDGKYLAYAGDGYGVLNASSFSSEWAEVGSSQRTAFERLRGQSVSWFDDGSRFCLVNFAHSANVSMFNVNSADEEQGFGKHIKANWGRLPEKLQGFGPYLRSHACAVIRSVGCVVEGRTDDKVVFHFKGESLEYANEHYAPVTAIQVSPHDDFLVTASADETLVIWRPQLGHRWSKTGIDAVTTLHGHSGQVNCVAISPARGLIASGGADKTIRLWNPSTGDLLETLYGHEDGVAGLAFLSGGHQLASVGHDGTLRLWRVSGVLQALAVNSK